MGLIIVNTDFVGKYKISANTFQATEFDNFITQYERDYLYKLLGKTLADLFIADLTNRVPVTQIYLDIYNSLYTEIYGCKYDSTGMKNMMLGFIYFEWMRKMSVNPTITGSVVNSNENSVQAGSLFDIYGRYNDSINNYKTIQLYCLDNSTDYPDFDGIELSYSHWSI
jgi:hypothetical protein